MIRILKSLLIMFVGLQALFYGLQNIANLEIAQAFVGGTLSLTGHESYPETMFFAITSPALHAVILWFIIACELAIGLLGIKGGWDLFAARNANPAAFQAAKRYGIASAGLALFLWFGLFMGVGGAFFQMWQTPAGIAALQGAFMYAMSSAIVLLFVCHTPDD
ncbi:DUF2165 domain-containing protein [Parasphingopyxis marina]|uniref:DUF2165 domain-containing protein n=1 Tax=Parasphingopyxis marina TaxID=2761622 RepID=A0A842I0T8_9SPHN|nr:DUF2165 domain-containing protein [Parasphingopyxis marina]MBC2778321.1 DUF2165 domain-containing protein [Parasphingopyxis marina]